jgi:hypothetical protein
MIASSDQHAIERQKIFGDDRWSKKRKWDNYWRNWKWKIELQSRLREENADWQEKSQFSWMNCEMRNMNEPKVKNRWLSWKQEFKPSSICFTSLSSRDLHKKKTPEIFADWKHILSNRNKNYHDNLEKSWALTRNRMKSSEDWREQNRKMQFFHHNWKLNGKKMLHFQSCDYSTRQSNFRLIASIEPHQDPQSNTSQNWGTQSCETIVYFEGKCVKWEGKRIRIRKRRRKDEK